MHDLAAAKHELIHQFARIAKAVSSPARIELLDLLAQGEKPVETLARKAGLSVTNTSNHLKELRTSGLVSTRREGAYVYYRLADPVVHELMRCLQNTAHRQLADVRQIVRDYFDEPEALEPVEAGELLNLMRADDVVVLDVRPEDEYASGHIPGAISMPVGELERRLAEMPADREIVAYCRGPYCVMAIRAVDILRSHGIPARRLEEGIPDWLAAGRPVTVGVEQ